MKISILVSVVAAIGTIVALTWRPRVSGAQDGNDQLAQLDGLRAMEFVRIAREIIATNPDLTTEVAKRAATLLRQPTTLRDDSYEAVAGLLELAKYEMSDLEFQTAKGQIADRLRAAQDVVELRQGIPVLGDLRATSAETAAVVVEWLREKDLSGITDADLLWLMQTIVGKELGRNLNASVTWTGRLVPPVSGEFVFSANSFDMRVNTGFTQINHQMVVRIDGREVLSARQADNTWRPRSAPVPLEADIAVPIDVVFQYERKGDYGDFRNPPTALLYWESAGRPREIIPSSALAQSDGGAGLMASYVLDIDGQSMTSTVPGDIVDHVWLSAGELNHQYRDEYQRLGQSLWDRLTAGTRLAEITNAAHADEYASSVAAAAGAVTSSDRSKLLAALLSTGDGLRHFSVLSMQRIQCAIGSSVPDEFVHLLGKWGQVQKDYAPTIVGYFRDANRDGFRALADDAIADTYRDVIATYLRTNNGECCLPIAYILSYVHLHRGRLPNWIDVLREQLADPSLSSQARLNWLFARAQAQELYFSGQHQPHFRGDENALAGREWLEEADLIAETEDDRLRAQGELAIRLILTASKADVDQFLESVSGRSTTEKTRQMVEFWRSEDARIRSERAALEQQMTDATLAAVRRDLQARSVAATPNRGNVRDPVKPTPDRSGNR
jgi:hypothetical protein